MDVISLQSGSSGNCFFIEAGDIRLLVDAGISGNQAKLRLEQHDRDIHKIDGLLITHDHNDHSRCMGIYHRKFGMPVYITERTLKATQRWCKVGAIDDINHFKPGDTITFTKGNDTVQVHSIPTPHDGVEGVAYVVEYGEHRLGILTDLGHVFEGLRDVLLSLDAVIIESNYDPKMLKYGTYPESVKRRIAGPGGHISNDESADLLSRVTMFGRLKWACLCHLSEENNCPDVAMRTHRRVLGNQLPVYVADRENASQVFRL